MGGKKTCAKSREWEKERRDKLNVCFNDLYKLLPEHDPSMSPSKMDILRKAAEYIRQLQEQNEEILKSGDDVLKDRTERLKKRVAYLVLKTRDLVNALKAAGVPIPSNKTKKSKNKGVQKTGNGKDQNHVPTTASSTQHISFALANGVKIINGTATPPMTSLNSKKVKCGCDKAAKKSPLSEVNGVTTRSTVVSTGDPVVIGNPQTQGVINSENPPRLANVGNAALTSTLGGGTIILRDGRVITVPSPSSIIPKILVKPPPAVIVMQRAAPLTIKRDRFPLIFPKRKDITQTTYMNKTPIPAIKTFRLEPAKKTPRPSKNTKKKKLKEDNPVKLGEKEKSSTSSAEYKDLSESCQSTTNNRKRKAADSANIPSKSSKSGSFGESINCIVNDGEILRDDVVTSCSNVVSGTSPENKLDKVEESATKLIVSEDKQPELSGSCGSVGENGIDAPLQLGSSSTVSDNSRMVSEEQPQDSDNPRPPSNNQSTNAVHSEKRDDLVFPDSSQTHIYSGIAEDTPSTRNLSEEIHSMSLPALPVEEEDRSQAVLNEATQSEAAPHELQGGPDVYPGGSRELDFKSLENQDDHSHKLNQFENVDIQKSIGTKSDVELRKLRVDSDIDRPPSRETHSEVLLCSTDKTQDERIVTEPDKFSVAATREKSSLVKDIPERSSMMQNCSENVNSQYDMNLPVHPEQMFSFDDSVHGQLESFATDASKSLAGGCEVVKESREDGEYPRVDSGKEDLNRLEKSSNSITGDKDTCRDARINKITSHDVAGSAGISSCEQLAFEKPNMIDDTRGALQGQVDSSCYKTGIGGINSHSTNMLIPNIAADKNNAVGGVKSFKAKASVVESIPSSTYSSGSQMYSLMSSEPPRTEGFFNYENPIAALPSSDTFFSNLTGKAVDICSVPSTVTPSACFSYNFTTQTPPVRSVARQLFPADPLCTIANSYNLLNSRQNEMDANLPHLSATNSQMFQFTSYSTSTSYRDPVFFANDFVATPTKTTSSVGTSENPPHNDKPSSTLHTTHSYTDLLQQPANINNFSNKSCNFSVASSISIDSNPTTSTQPKTTNQKQSTSAEPQLGISTGNQSEQITKPCNSEGNFSMNVITSSSSAKSEIKHPAGYPKSSNTEPSRNLSFNYLHPHSQTQSLPVNQEVGYNLYIRDPLPKTLPNHNFCSTSDTVPINSSVISEKNFQKLPNVELNSPKPSVAKDFNAVPFSGGSSAESRDRFGLQSNIFQDTCSHYAEHPSKSRRVNSGGSLSNFQGGGNSVLSNQSVQTQQSYLGGVNTQQSTQVTKNAVSLAGNRTFTGSTQNQHLMNVDKFSRGANMHQVLPQVNPSPHYSVKSSLGHQLSSSSAPDCVSSLHSTERYRTSVVQTSSSMPIQNQEVFSTSKTFSHANFSSQHRFYQSPTFGSYANGSSSNNSQAIYTNPTTAAPSNQGYLQGVNTSSAGTINRGQNLGMAPPPLNSQLPNPTNVLPSSTGLIFSAVESLAHHSINKNHNVSSMGNPVQHQGQPAANPPTGNFPGLSASQSINNSSNRKPVHNDGISSFNMSSIASYAQNSSLSDNQSKHLHTSASNYNNIQTSSQNVTSNKSSSQSYTRPPNNHNPLSKQCDYPLASILTDLNDPVLTGSTLNSVNNSHIKNMIQAKNLGCREKDKQYSTNTEGSSFKMTDNSCNSDYLRSKENERNSFIPIMDDVRINSEFSNDLFSSLQVPPGGAHSDSISPTAAFLLAFPLVSTSKNTENLHDQDQAENNTSTPTTILQIGNIEPPNSELFHPLEFGKDIETPDYLGHVQDKCKRKEGSVNQDKPKKQANVYAPQTYNYSSMSGDFSVSQYEQPWNETQNKNKPVDRKKNEKITKQFSSNAYEFCKQDKKKKSKISVNWMAAPDASDTFQKEVESSSFPAANLPFSMDIDGLPDFCSSKKNSSGIYSWSPSKSLLPIDNGMLIPSTLPTLVGDLALGTTTPSDPFVKRCDVKKSTSEKPEKNQNSQKSQNNFLSVSQLVDPKSKKPKIPETKCKKPEKKKSAAFGKRKEEPCMYPDNFLPPLGWDKYRYKNNYSAEALIGSQEINESLNFSYQQNTNYFMGTDFNQELHSQSQQYQNSFSFSQNQFSSFVTEEYQNDNFSLNQPQGPSKRSGGSDKRDGRCRDESSSRFLGVAGSNSSNYHHAALNVHPHAALNVQPYSAPPIPSSSTASSQPPNIPSNSTTSVTNFNLSTIFPEINERTGSQSQQSATPQQQQNHHQQQNSVMQHPHNSMGAFSNNTNNSYRPHNIGGLN